MWMLPLRAAASEVSACVEYFRNHKEAAVLAPRHAASASEYEDTCLPWRTCRIACQSKVWGAPDSNLRVGRLSCASSDIVGISGINDVMPN